MQLETWSVPWERFYGWSYVLGDYLHTVDMPPTGTGTPWQSVQTGRSEGLMQNLESAKEEWKGKRGEKPKQGD